MDGATVPIPAISGTATEPLIPGTVPGANRACSRSEATPWLYVGCGVAFLDYDKDSRILRS